MVRLNLIPFGNRGKDKKGENFPTKWKRYQHEYYDGRITDDSNIALITGKLPGRRKQVVVIDFDGEMVLSKYREIHRILRSWNSEMKHFREVSWTGNNGFHFIYICDLDHRIRNIQKRKIKKGIFGDYVKGIDIRGNGGLIFYPPTCFIDGNDRYRSVWKHIDDKILPSKIMKEFIDYIYEPEDTPVFDVSEIQEDIKIIYNERISSLRQPFQVLLSEGAPDIEVLAEQTGVAEFLYWKALWVEVIFKEIDPNLVFRLLGKYQPAFDYAKTVHQLQYIDENNRPLTNYKLKELFPWYKPKFYRGFVLDRIKEDDDESKNEKE